MNKGQICTICGETYLHGSRPYDCVDHEHLSSCLSFIRRVSEDELEDQRKEIRELRREIEDLADSLRRLENPNP